MDTKKKKKRTCCEICNKNMRSKYHLKQHLAVHTGEKNFICGLCKKGYQQKWNLITHMTRVHSKIKPFKCTDCNKEFGYSSHFKRHVKTHFLDNIEAPDSVKLRILNPHKCEFCEKSFETNYRLNIHMRKHTGCRPFVCDRCNKSFTTRRLIAIHMKKKHDVDYDFICDQCGEPFPDRASIISHIKTGHKLRDMIVDRKVANEIEINTSDKRKKEIMPCEVCGKGILRTSMKKHVNIHYRNRVYACRFCNKEFLESGQRKVHERKHTGEKPYLCDVCGRGHSQYGNLLTHRKRYHNLTEKTPNLWKKSSENCGDFKNKPDDLQDRSTKNDESNERVSYDAYSEPTKQIALKQMQDSVTSETSKEEDTDKNSAKHIYTGNETIEDFLTIASDWISKKCSESKIKGTAKATQSESFKEDEPSCPSPDSLISQNQVDSPCSDITLADTVGVTVKASSDEENVDCSETAKSSETLKKVKSHISNIIFNKIIQDLEKNSSATKEMSDLRDSIKECKSSTKVDKLRQLLKNVKFVPDNVVMKRKNGKICWHCWECSSKFSSRHLLSRHLLIHEPEENRPYKCEICRKSFTQSNNYKEHLMSHNNQNQFYCEKCGSGFRHKSHFNVHYKRHLDSNGEAADSKPKKFQCAYCDKRFNTNFHKNEHQRTHTKEKPYLCKVCGHQFSALSTLNRHQRTHANARYQCNVCLKFFREKFSLKRHLATHSVCYRVSCDSCGNDFSQNASLKKHKMICEFRQQPLIKPFSCVICVKKFLTKSDLKRHVATHDTTKKFKCSLCLTRLKTEETYKRHLRRHEQSSNSTNIFSCQDCNSNFSNVKALKRHAAKVHVSS